MEIVSFLQLKWWIFSWDKVGKEALEEAIDEVEVEPKEEKREELLVKFFVIHAYCLGFLNYRN